MKPTKFNSELVGEGVSVQEMVKLLQLYNEVQDYKVIRDKVFKENYLGKNSDSRIENILRAFRKRFLNNSQLPPPELLGEIMKSDVLSDFGKQQLLLPYYLYSDNLLRTAYYELVVKSIRLEKSLSLNHSDVLDFLKNIGKKHSNIRKWSKNLKSKWATRFLTFLRTFDMLENYPKNKIKKPQTLQSTNSRSLNLTNTNHRHIIYATRFPILSNNKDKLSQLTRIGNDNYIKEQRL